MKKCPNGMFSEIKYDGERVQVHKNGDRFNYFSRSLKPVLPHKVRVPSSLQGLSFPSCSLRTARLGFCSHFSPGAQLGLFCSC